MSLDHETMLGMKKAEAGNDLVAGKKKKKAGVKSEEVTQ